MACAPSEDSDQPGHPPSLIRVFAVRMKKAWVLSYPLSAQRRLIRLSGCPGWSESSLGAQSLCWFFRPDMTEKLLTGKLSLNTNKQTLLILSCRSSWGLWACPCHCPCRSLWNLQITRTDIKYQMSLKLGHIALSNLELHVLDCWKKPIFDLLGMLGLRWAIIAHWATCFRMFSIN